MDPLWIGIHGCKTHLNCNAGFPRLDVKIYICTDTLIAKKKKPQSGRYQPFTLYNSEAPSVGLDLTSCHWRKSGQISNVRKILQ